MMQKSFFRLPSHATLTHQCSTKGHAFIPLRLSMRGPSALALAAARFVTAAFQRLLSCQFAQWKTVMR
ncbi:MAG: hypothetical protein B7Z21_00085 [Verrucomicrobiales bacterium 32-60-5]|nr:MAG: hypothetical protein B7Z21_00085 [Verrucomicrobiales bacterium 32-60-5]